jgi:hypothetical protein
MPTIAELRLAVEQALSEGPAAWNEARLALLLALLSDPEEGLVAKWREIAREAHPVENEDEHESEAAARRSPYWEMSNELEATLKEVTDAE